MALVYSSVAELRSMANDRISRIACYQNRIPCYTVVTLHASEAGRGGADKCTCSASETQISLHRDLSGQQQCCNLHQLLDHCRNHRGSRTFV